MARIDIPFVVEKQQISQPTREKLVAGGKNYFYATFVVNDTWDDISNIKAVFVRGDVSKLMELTKTDSGYECMIPWEVMVTKGVFCVGIFGGDTMLTGMEYVEVKQGCVTDGGEPLAPTPDWFTRIEKETEYLNDRVANIEDSMDSGVKSYNDLLNKPIIALEHSPSTSELDKLTNGIYSYTPADPYEGAMLIIASGYEDYLEAPDGKSYNVYTYRQCIIKRSGIVMREKAVSDYSEWGYNWKNVSLNSYTATEEYVDDAIGDVEKSFEKIIENLKKDLNSYAPTRSYVNLLGGSDNWVAEDVTDSTGNVIGSRYGQIVNVNNAEITPNSKVDLQISSEQMVIFHEKDLAFVAENEDGVVTIYCIGNVPENDYTLQATVTEVGTNE